MLTLPSKHKRRSPVKILQQWWQAWTSNGTVFANPCCNAESEVERIAGDVGLPAAELRRLASAGLDSTALLLLRMQALDLDRKKVARLQPQAFRDLQCVCTLCKSHRQCTRDLSRNAADPVWEDYCPNVATLEALSKLPQVLRSEGWTRRLRSARSDEE